MSPSKTNAMRLLDTLGIAYETMTYDGENGEIDGVAVAKKVGKAPEVVFKTLVCLGHSGSPMVFCIPVGETLDLKAAARAAGEKNVAMLPLARLLPTTGYRHGGCSPVGMKKKLPTYIADSARQYPHILVNAGRIGMQVELAPEDLCRAAEATWFQNH